MSADFPTFFLTDQGAIIRILTRTISRTEAAIDLDLSLMPMESQQLKTSSLR